jgi:hypothetical protein
MSAPWPFVAWKSSSINGLYITPTSVELPLATAMETPANGTPPICQSKKAYFSLDAFCKNCTVYFIIFFLEYDNRFALEEVIRLLKLLE